MQLQPQPHPQQPDPRVLRPPLNPPLLLLLMRIQARAQAQTQLLGLRPRERHLQRKLALRPVPALVPVQSLALQVKTIVLVRLLPRRVLRRVVERRGQLMLRLWLRAMWGWRWGLLLLGLCWFYRRFIKCGKKEVD